ncbi:MAG: hypothetical protein RR945_00295 [Erysipelotrichaceae bacterium]
MFNKLLKFFFEEVEDDTVIADDELEPISIKTPIQKAAPVITKPLDTTTKEPVKKTMVDIRVEDTPIKMQAKEEPISQKHKNFNIELSKEERQVRETRSRSTKIERSEYDFSPVISPMFGMSDYDEKGITDELRHVSTMKPKKLNALGTIISPIFGAQELADMEEDAQEKIKIERMEPINLKDEALPNYSIDEMITQDNQDEIENTSQSTQFSLFGEDESLNEPIKYKMDEEC